MNQLLNQKKESQSHNRSLFSFKNKLKLPLESSPGSETTRKHGNKDTETKANMESNADAFLTKVFDQQ